MPDGSIRISTRIDNSKLNKDIVEIENKIKKLQRNNSKNSLEQNNLQDEISKYNELCIKADEYHHKIKELNTEKKLMLSANPELSVSAGNPKYENLKNQIIEMKQKYEETTKEIDKQAPKIEKVRLKLQDVKAKQEENNTKIAEYNRQLQESQKKQFDLNYNTEGISKSLSKGITKILKYGMALFSIRSIYGLLSNAMNSWLSGNSKGAKQLRSDIDYMKNAIGGALSPILKYIVNLLYQALGFTGALIKAFTGIDIFAGSIADYMSSTTSSASKTNKELKKQLTNFDRINKLEKNDTSTVGGSGGGIVTPSQDLSSIMDKYAEKAKRIKEIFDEIKDIIPIIALGFATWKIGSSVLEFLDKLGLIQDLGKALKITAGISLIIGGIWLEYKAIKKLLEGDFSAETILQGLAGAALVAVGGALVFGTPVGITIGLTLTLGTLLWAEHNEREAIWRKIAEEEGFDYDNATFFGKIKFKITIDWRDFWENAGNYCSNGSNILKNSLILILLDILDGIADFIEDNFPIAGKKIADAIRSGVKNKREEISGEVEEALGYTSDKNGVVADKKGRIVGDKFTTGIIKNIREKNDDVNITMENSLLETARKNQMTATKVGEQLGGKEIDGISSKIKGNQEYLTKTLSNTMQNANNNTNVSNASEIGIKEINGIKLGQASQTNSLSSNLSGIVRNANNSVDTSSSNSIGYNIVRGINSGINNNKWSLFSTMTSLGNRLLSNFKSALGIHSPSREMASLAKFIPLGIAEGIDSTSDKAVGSMKDLVADIEDTASNMNVQYNIPKISRNAISYVPKQAISTNEVQRSIIGNSDILDKLLKENNTNKEYTFILPVSVDGEVFYKTIIKKKEKDLFATNGGY